MKNATKLGTVVIAGLFAGASSLILAQSTATGPAVKPAAVAKQSRKRAARWREDREIRRRHQVQKSRPPTARPTMTASGSRSSTSTATAMSRTPTWCGTTRTGSCSSYTVGAFGCKNGGTATAELLIGINAAGNPRKRPAGSGFWVASLDKGECGAQAAGMWGCKFDASGAETACGVAAIDEKTDDLIIATVAK